MCGIAGFISTLYNKEHLQKMTNSIAHRGPDAEGFFEDENQGVYLGHRRLSILDLSNVANQPMTSHCGRYVMVYNGEIYNYKEIRDSKFTSHKWITTSDTEVVLESYAKYGSMCFEWFNGMFALVIWDKQNKELIIARDQMGIKPLFVYQDENIIAFASEIKAIKSIIPHLEINKKAIPYFLHLGYIPHPITIFKKINKFSAGEYAFIKESTITRHQYWSVQNNILPTVVSNEKEAKFELKRLLFDAVEKQLVSDVSIGTFLSGGTDSSIITAIATKVSLSKINTFSIAVTDGIINEAPFAAATAKYLGTQHHEMPISQKEIIALAPTLLDIYDEPFADSSAFPTLMISKLANEHVSVALSGDGGDELFLGYGRYAWPKRLSNPLLQKLKPIINTSSKIMSDRYQQIGEIFQRHPQAHAKSHLFSQEQCFFSEVELKELLIDDEFNFNNINEDISGRDLDEYEKNSFWDIENYLKDDLLVKVDRATMQFSLETRVPFLDKNLVEFALNLDTSLKIKNKTSKYLLKEVLYELVPKQILDRPKWGFNVPLVKWLKSDLKWMVEEYCSEAMCKRFAVVNNQAVKRLVKKYQSGHDHLYNRVWTIIILHWFLSREDNIN